MEDVVIQRVAVACLVTATVGFIWFMFDARKQAKIHMDFTQRYTEFVLDRMKVQDLEDRWTDGSN
jgi:hypothetical protein